MKILKQKNLLFYSLLLICVPFVYAQETAWLDPDHCTVRWIDKDWDNYGQCSGTCDMIIGQITYDNRGLIYFPLSNIPINSIITNHSEIPIKCTENYPQSSSWKIRAVSIEKDPKTTIASEVFTDCADGTGYKILTFNPGDMQDIIQANKLKSKMQSNLENNKNWIAVGFYAYDPYDLSGYKYKFDDDYLSVDYVVVDIYNVQESNITENSARISWNTSQSSWTFLRYKEKGSSSPWIEIEFQTFRTNHQVDITGLSNNTEYEYKIGIRINGYDTKNKNAYKDSFKTDIHREITVTFPENDYLLLENNNYTITWTSENVDNNVKIEFSSNGGSNWSNVASSVSNSGSYNWTVPGSVGSDDCKIKITDLVHQDISDESDGLFLIFSNIQSSINDASSGEKIILIDDIYTENVTINKNITLQGSESQTIRGHTEISSTSAAIKWLKLEPGSIFGTALGIYNSTATIHSCYIKKGPYTGLWGIWCSYSTLLLSYGSVFTESYSTNTSIFLINAGSSSYIYDCTIKPGNGIAIDGSAAGYAQICVINTYPYKDSGYDINAYFADGGMFELDDNNYGSAQEINDPGGYVSGDGWNEGLAKPVLFANQNSSNSGMGDLDNLLNQADSLIARGKFDEGTDLLKTIISNYPDEMAAISALHKLVSYRNERDLEEANNIYSMENQSDLAGIQQKLADNHPLKLKAQEYEINNDVRLGNVEEAINKSFEFSEKYAHLENGRRVLLGIADIFHFVTKDEDAEKKIYELFLETYPDHQMSEYVKLKLQDQPLTPAMNPETEPVFSIYPNPFNLETQIKFWNSETIFVNLSIYNSMGQLIKNLVNKSLPEGSHTVVWDGKNKTGDVIASGLYFCSLKTDKNVVTQKLLLVK